MLWRLVLTPYRREAVCKIMIRDFVRVHQDDEIFISFSFDAEFKVVRAGWVSSSPPHPTPRDFFVPIRWWLLPLSDRDVCLHSHHILICHALFGPVFLFILEIEAARSPTIFIVPRPVRNSGTI